MLSSLNNCIVFFLFFVIIRKNLNDRNKNIIHGLKNNKIDPKKCDICEEETNLDCHHIIPHEFTGPDINVNYVFICNKKCHNLLQIIGGFIYGSITGLLYYILIGKRLKNINLF